MSLAVTDVANLLAAFSLLLLAAHAVGALFQRFRQPKAIGEIVGGLLLGPSGLGAISPEWHRALFETGRATPAVLAAAYQFGLLLLLFCAGTEIRLAFDRAERRTVLVITVAGTAISFGCGVLFAFVAGPASLAGPAGNDAALFLTSGAVMAATSIPILARIFLDLRVMETAFARIALASAVLGSVALYIVQSVALGLVARGPDEAVGVPAWLSIDPSRAVGALYQVVVTLGFFLVALGAGPAILRRVVASPLDRFRRANSIAFDLLLMLAVTGIAVVFGIPPIFGAFAAGFAAGSAGQRAGEVTTIDVSRERDTIKAFAFASFVPVTFAFIGLNLDLGHDFAPLLFLAFLATAFVVKGVAVYAAARFAGESRTGSRNFAAALNARGAIGIVLAALAHDARIVSDAFYTTLVLTAIVTALAAGAWLAFVTRRNLALR